MVRAHNVVTGVCVTVCVSELVDWLYVDRVACSLFLVARRIWICYCMQIIQMRPCLCLHVDHVQLGAVC